MFLELSFSTSFQIGARGEIDARLVFSEFGEQGGKETERVLQTKAQAEIGLFGEASLIFGMTNEGKYYGRYETSGIYLSASASLLGYDFNFYDDPNTIEVEEKIYLLDKEEIILFDSQPLSAQSISASAAGQYLEDALYQEALVLLKEYENKTSEVCAKVRLQVNQDAIMTRSAFLGKLEIENENDEFSIQNIDIDLEVRDANGNLVSSDLFIIQSPVLSGIDAIDGTGIIGINSAGSAEFTIVPSGLAATEAPTVYTIGGSFSYTENGNQVSIPLAATAITVLPQAELYLHYFQQRDVIGDDPFTEAIESSEAFALGMLVSNQGKGTANNLEVISNQPKIVENEKGLLTDFKLVGATINGKETNTFNANFGNIEGGETAVAVWSMESALQGKFSDHKATFQHVNALGDEEFSLIKNVEIHELIRQVESSFDNDQLADFLVNDIDDLASTPDALYLSDGSVASVSTMTGATVSGFSQAKQKLDIAVAASTGWSYLRITDPLDGQARITKVLRSDGSEVALTNVWASDRTFPKTGRPTYENTLHLLDYNNTGAYTLFFDAENPIGPTITNINDIPLSDTQTAAVSFIDVTFSEVIDSTSFDFRDVVLLRDDGSNLITQSVTAQQLTETTYRINGLASLTGENGVYDLIVNATGIKDLDGTRGTGALTNSWTTSGISTFGTLQGTTWNDLNGNRRQDTGEAGLADWTVYLDANANGTLDDGEVATLTNENGDYTFSDLSAGTYTVSQVVENGWQQTYPTITTTADSIELFTPSAPIAIESETAVTTTDQLISLNDFHSDPRFSNISGNGYASVIIDTGIDIDHSFFGPDADSNGVADRIVYQYDFGDNDTDASDKNGHGSHVASVIGSSDRTYSGIAPDANLIALKVFKDSGSGSFSDLERSLQWVINNANAYNIASINLSLGDEKNWTTPQGRYGIGDELAALSAMGIVVAAAAGNNFAKFNSQPGVAYPAADPTVISVGAVQLGSDKIADFSQRDPDLLDVFAPGSPIVGADANGGIKTLSGTSQAAPYISGIAVLSQQIAVENLGRKLTAQEFETLIKTTGVVINDGDDEVDTVANTGLDFSRVDMLAIAEAILTLSREASISSPT